jgi:hypothetical protein
MNTDHVICTPAEPTSRSSLGHLSCGFIAVDSPELLVGRLTEQGDSRDQKVRASVSCSQLLLAYKLSYMDGIGNACASVLDFMQLTAAICALEPMLWCTFDPASKPAATTYYSFERQQGNKLKYEIRA